MRALHVINSMDPRAGGVCQAVRNLTSPMLEQGHAVEVVCLDEPNADFIAKEGFPIHALGTGRGSWRYNGALRPWLDENLRRFDVAIMNGLWQFPSHALSSAARAQGNRPYFVFPHGMLDPWFQRAAGRRLKAVRNWFYWKFIEEHVVRNAAGLLFTCGEEMRLAHESFRPYRPQRQINVGFGVAEPPARHAGMEKAFQEKCPGIKDRPFFLFLGRIDSKKGVDILVEAYGAIRRSQAKPSTNNFPCLVIAGPGLDTPYGQKVKALADSSCPPDSVLWPGMLSGDAKWGAFYGCEAFALTSHQENFGIAVAEAMSCGKLVLISNRVNIWREIEEDKAGLIGEDTRGGADYLFQRWENLSLDDRVSMGEAARKSYETRFGVDQVARRLVAAVEGLLDRYTLQTETSKPALSQVSATGKPL